MLILPTILIVLSGVSGAGGLMLTAKSTVDSLNATAKNRFVQERNERNLLRFDSCSENLDKSLNDLGKQRMVITKNFNVFIDAFEKIHNRPEFSTGENVDFPKFDIKEIRNVSVVAEVTLGMAGGAVIGSSLGAAAASGTTTAVIALGKASTGVKIANLAGAAKVKAALAALGGGAINCGGGGIALGTLVLNAASVGVGVLVEGIAMAYVGSFARKQADKAEEILLDNEKIIEDAIKMQLEVTCAIDEMKRVSVNVCNKVYKRLVFQMKQLVEEKNDWNLFTDEEKLLVENNILIVQILHYLNNIPLYKVAKYNEERDEVEEIEANTKEVESAIKKAQYSVERIIG